MGVCKWGGRCLVRCVVGNHAFRAGRSKVLFFCSVQMLLSSWWPLGQGSLSLLRCVHSSGLIRGGGHLYDVVVTCCRDIWTGKRVGRDQGNIKAFRDNQVAVRAGRCRRSSCRVGAHQRNTNTVVL